ncbi:branched-chain amino acid ABC transporter permease [Candidatus Pacearchaeota archaeon]|nr:MAG: branched-chain amino acid ABC transporter permease [Candidatus Pacearchaeota archaeon]
MPIALQYVLNGIITGSIYALVAAGFALIYSTNKFMHFAHGAVVVLAGYFFYSLFSSAHLSIFLALPLTLVFGSLVGLAVYKLAYQPMQKKRASNVVLLILSIALLILIENAIQAIYGADVQQLSVGSARSSLEFAGARITLLQLAIIASSVVFFIFLWLGMNKTSLGRKMRAVADSRELADIAGIDSRKVIAWSFVVGSFLAAFAGTLIGMEQNLTPTMGTNLMVKAFAGAVVGGVASVPGAIAGSYLVGLAENLGIVFLPSSYKDAIAFALLFIFLLAKPEGLFGIEKGVKDV